MTQQIINVGAAINDGTGDPARTAFTKCNDNFTELYPRDVPQCGRLLYASATALSFKPFNGDRIKINGTIFAIPSAGIAGVANTSVFVNGTGSSNLAASTVYWVFAFSNSGTVTADFRTAATHATSTTAGNEGVEIRTGDDTRTLIGLVRTNASSQFQNDAANRFVISWFNRRNIGGVGAHTGGATTASASYVELSTAARVSFLNWGDEAVLGSVLGTASTSASGGTTDINVGIDSASAVFTADLRGTSTPANDSCSFGLAAYINASEGFHYITPICRVNAGTATATIGAGVMIRG